MEPTAIFCDQVREAWGSPCKVADAAFSELFRHGDDIGLDYDDQIGYTKQVGLLAELMKDGTPDEFIAAFKEQVLNDE